MISGWSYAQEKFYFQKMILTLTFAKWPISSVSFSNKFLCKSRTWISLKSEKDPPPLREDKLFSLKNINYRGCINDLLTCSNNASFLSILHLVKTPAGAFLSPQSMRSYTGSGDSWAWKRISIITCSASKYRFSDEFVVKFFGLMTNHFLPWFKYKCFCSHWSYLVLVNKGLQTK